MGRAWIRGIKSEQVWRGGLTNNPVSKAECAQPQCSLQGGCGVAPSGRVMGRGISL